MDVLMSETCWAQKKWNKTLITSDIKLVSYSPTITTYSCLLAVFAITGALREILTGVPFFGALLELWMTVNLNPAWSGDTPPGSEKGTRVHYRHHNHYTYVKARNVCKVAWDAFWQYVVVCCRDDSMCTSGMTIRVLMGRQFVYCRDDSMCTAGMTVCVLQVWQYVYCRDDSMCTAGTTVCVLQRWQYVYCRDDNACTAGMTMRILQRWQYVYCRDDSMCTAGTTVCVLQGWQYVYCRGEQRGRFRVTQMYYCNGFCCLLSNSCMLILTGNVKF